MRGIASKCIISYMTSIKQYVSIQDTSSEHKEIPYGVPQGSILGERLSILMKYVIPTLIFTLFFR